jgi:hypothetical protein
MFYLIVWHESDGNDCTVYDTVVEAPTEDEALSLLGDALEARMTANGTDFQEDGNHIGYYFNCSEDCPEDCEGHGGTSLRTVESYTTEVDARAMCSRWHSEWSMPNA